MFDPYGIENGEGGVSDIEGIVNASWGWRLCIVQYQAFGVARDESSSAVGKGFEAWWQ